MYVSNNTVRITERAVTGLAVVMGLTLAGVTVAILTVTIFIMKRRRMSQNAFMSSKLMVYSQYIAIACYCIVHLNSIPFYNIYCQCCCALSLIGFLSCLLGKLNDVRVGIWGVTLNS